MINIFRQNKKNFLLAILILAAASTGITLTAVYAVCGPGTSSTTNPFCPPYQLQDSSNSNAVRVTVDNLGNVGIGTTSPADKLDVASGALIVGKDASYAIKTRISDGTIKPFFAESGGGTYFYDAGGAAIIYRNQADSAELARITDSGNVGIGITSPTTRLQVATPGGGNLYVSDYGCGSYGGIGGNPTLTGCTNYALLTGGQDTFINRPSGYTIGFRENNGQEMTIASGGNVGIGTTSPAQKLDVSGNIRLSGNLTSASTNEFKLTAPAGIPICIGTGC